MAAFPCDRRLRERIESERQAVRALLKKAEALVAHRRNRNGAAAKAHGKKTTRAEAPTAMDGAASPKKRRKTAPMVEVEVEVIEPTMPMAQRDRLAGLLSSVSTLPPHIVELMQSQCCCFVCPNGDGMDIDLGSTKDAVLFKLLNLLEEFSHQQTKIEAVDASDAVSQLEEGEIADGGADMDICGGVSPLVVVDNVQFSPLPIPKQQEDDELIDICDVSPVSLNKFPETSPSSSRSSSSSSGSSCSDSSSSASSSASSGSSSSGSSSSSSDSDSDDSDEDSASSSPEDTSDLPIGAEAKPLEQQQVTEQNKELITERAAASPDTQMQELIARAQEKQKLQLVLEREKAREQPEEMKRKAQPVYESIDPRLMKQLGISKEVEYMVSPVFSRDSVRRRGGGLLQKLGFFLKP